MKKNIIALSILIITVILCTGETTNKDKPQMVGAVAVPTTTTNGIIFDNREQETTDMYTQEDIQKAQDYLETLQVNIPQEIIEICEEIGNNYGICPEILESMCWCETRCTYKIISDADAYGIMQVCPKWHKDRMERLEVDNLFDPYQCILTGADYLSELLETYTYIDQAITAYNQGYCNNVTNEYSQKVMEIAMALECVHASNSTTG